MFFVGAAWIAMKGLRHMRTNTQLQQKEVMLGDKKTHRPFARPSNMIQNGGLKQSRQDMFNC